MRPHEFDFLQLFSRLLIILGSVIAAVFAATRAGEMAYVGILIGFVLGVLGILGNMKLNDYLLSVRGNFEGERDVLLDRIHFALNAANPVIISAASFFLVKSIAPLV